MAMVTKVRFLSLSGKCRGGACGLGASFFQLPAAFGPISDGSRQIRINLDLFFAPGWVRWRR
jgi:hypothetical protein